VYAVNGSSALLRKKYKEPIAVTTLPEAWVCGCLLAGIVGSNPIGGMALSFVRVVCCQVEVSASS
jgi:hypothetical protein